ncbi:MAG: hypothetical protein ACP5UZ_07485 [Thermoplasmata archaeon]
MAAFVVLVALPRTPNVPTKASLQPTFTFLSNSSLTSMYGFSIRAINNTEDLSAVLPLGEYQ